MRTLLFLCAEGVSIDRQSNKISAYNILEEVLAAGFPLLLQELVLLASYSKEPGDADKTSLTVRISSGETELFQHDAPFDFQDKPKARLVFRIKGLVIPSAMPVNCEILSGGRVLSKYRIFVKAAAKPTAENPDANPESAQDEGGRRFSSGFNLKKAVEGNRFCGKSRDQRDTANDYPPGKSFPCRFGPWGSLRPLLYEARPGFNCRFRT